jgi:hypothetical protein
MKTRFMFIVCAAMLSLWSGVVQAQEHAPSQTTFSVETDPSTFLFKGYALHVRIKPKHSQHWVVGAGAYALDMPSLMVNLNADNKNRGWNVRINSAYGLFGEYYLKEVNRGWFLGLQTSIQNYKISNDNLAGTSSRYRNLLLMPSVGYNWHPFRFPLYLKPWAGVGYTTRLSGENRVRDRTYHIVPLVPFFTMHVGFTF